MLECNSRTIHDLKRLVDLVGESRVLRELGVHRTTLRRWLSGSVRCPGAQALAVRALLGDLPGTAGAWKDWRFHDGKLVSPGGDTFSAGDVLSLIFLRQQLSAQRRELDTLRARVRVLEHLTQESANEARSA